MSGRIAGMIVAAAVSATLPAAADDTPSAVVHCHDAQRGTVAVVLSGRCDGEVVSAEQAEAIRGQRARRIRRAMNGMPGPLEPGLQLRGIGTGFFVNDRGAVVTNNHVIDGCSALSAETTTGERHKARLIGADPVIDLAALATDASPPGIARFRRQPGLQRGERADLIGYPTQGVAPIVPFFSPGAVLNDVVPALGQDDSRIDSARFLVQGEVRQGNSGGPVLDERGDVIGVIFAQANLPEIYRRYGRNLDDTGVAVHNSHVLQFLAAQDVPYVSAGEAGSQPRDAVFGQARSFVVRVGCWR